MQTERRRPRTDCVVALLVLTAVGCGSPSTTHNNLKKIDLDRSDPRSFISYYFGGLESIEGEDPFQSGLVTEVSGEFFLDVDALATRTGLDAAVVDENEDAVLDWSELEPFLVETYYARRPVPTHLDSIGSIAPSFDLEVDGVMTTARRTIRLSEAAITDALSHYLENGERLIYPVGTVFVADHKLGGRTVETSFMRKRSDGHWDYAVYDSTGFLAKATQTPPKPLTVPTQCVGCHLGSRLYEPEKSFPAAAPPGPAGPRAIHWSGAKPDLDLVRFFDEHRKRSDGILGLYATLFVTHLREERVSGTISGEHSRLLDTLGL